MLTFPPWVLKVELLPSFNWRWDFLRSRCCSSCFFFNAWLDQVTYMLRTSRGGSCQENIFLHACQKVGLPHPGLLWYFVVWSSSLSLFSLQYLVQKVQVLLDLLASVSKIVHYAETEKSARGMSFAVGRGPAPCPACPARPCPWPAVATACVDEHKGFASRE